MPIVDRLIVSLLGQIGQHLGIIHSNLWRNLADILLKRRQIGRNIITLALLELLLEIARPREHIYRVGHLVLEEVVHTLALFGCHLLLETVEIDLNQRLAVLGMKDITILGADDIQFTILRRLPIDAATLNHIIQHNCTRIEYGREEILGHTYAHSLSLFHGQDINFQLSAIVLKLLARLNLIWVVAIANPADSIVVQTRCYASLGALTRKPSPYIPPLVGEDSWVTRLCTAIEAILFAIEDSIGLGVGVDIADSKAIGCRLAQNIELGRQTLARESIATPPIERHITITFRWLLKSRQDIELFASIGITLQALRL